MRNRVLILFAVVAGTLAFSSASLWLNEPQQRNVQVTEAGEIEDLRDPNKLRGVRVSVVDPTFYAVSITPGDGVDIFTWRIVGNERVPAIVARNIPVLEMQWRFNALLLTVEADEWQARKLQNVPEAGELSFAPHGSVPLPVMYRVLDQPFDPEIFPWYHRTAG